MAGFQWTKAAQDAAALVAEGGQSFDALAVKVGISRKTLGKWRAHALFKIRVETIRTEYRDASRQLRLVALKSQVAVLRKEWRQLRRACRHCRRTHSVRGIPYANLPPEMNPEAIYID